MPFDFRISAPLKHSLWGSSVPLSLTIISGFLRITIRLVNSRITRLPDIDVPGIAARHSRVPSATMLSTLNRRPVTIWSCTKWSHKIRHKSLRPTLLDSAILLQSITINLLSYKRGLLPFGHAARLNLIALINRFPANLSNFRSRYWFLRINSLRKGILARLGFTHIVP